MPTPPRLGRRRRHRRRRRSEPAPPSTSPRRACDVVLVERDQLGSGSTSQAAGGVRAQFSDELNIEIAQRSLAAFRAFGDRPGWEIDLHEVGYLFLLTTRATTSPRSSAASRSRTALGVPSRILTPGGGPRAVPPDRGRRRPRRRLLARGRPRDPRRRRPGLRQRSPRARRPPRRRTCEVARDRRRRRHGSSRALTSEGTIAHRHRHLRRRRLVARLRRSSPASTSRSCRCAARSSSPSRWPDLPAKPADDDRLRDDLLLPPRGPGPADGDVRPGRAPGLRLRDAPTTGFPGCWRSPQRRAPRIATAGIRGGWAGPLRDDARTTTRSSARPRRVAASSTPRASPATASCRARRPASSCATSYLERAAVRRHRAAGRASASSQARPAPRVQHRLMPDLRQRPSARGPVAVERRRGRRGAPRGDRRGPPAARRADQGDPAGRAARRSRAARSATRCGCSSATGLVEVHPRTAAPSSPTSTPSTCSRSTRCGRRSARSPCTS